MSESKTRSFDYRRIWKIVKTVLYPLVIVGIAGAGVYFLPMFAIEKDPIEAPVRPPLAVAVAKVKTSSVSDFEFSDGTARAVQREYLVFKNGGRVAFLKTNSDGGPLREGDAVKSGELLAELDRAIDDATAKTVRAELDSARSRLANAKTEWERYKRLVAQKAVSKSEAEARKAAYEQALNDVRTAEARLDQVTANLRDIQVRAPFDGVVSFVNIREGQYVPGGGFDVSSEKEAARTAPITVINPKAFEIIVELPVTSGKRIQVGQAAFVLDETTLASFQQSGYVEKTESSLQDVLSAARVGSVSPAIDPSGRSIRARVITDQPIEGLRDGTYVTVWIEVDKRENATIVPVEAIIERGDELFVFVLDPGTNTVNRRNIKVGLFGFEGVEVTSGLSVGEVVVTQGRYRLSDGMAVRSK